MATELESEQQRIQPKAYPKKVAMDSVCLQSFYSRRAGFKHPST